jgi:hydrogenase expression/formation protein HypC
MTGEHGTSTSPECHDGVCITCSDTAVPVTIVRLLDDDLAVVDTGQGEEEVSVALVSAAVGDTILVHAKEAIAVVPSEPEGRGVAWTEERGSLRPSDEGRGGLQAPRRRATRKAPSEPEGAGRWPG